MKISTELSTVTSLGLSIMRYHSSRANADRGSRPLRTADCSGREQQLLANPFFFKEAVGLGGFRHRQRPLRAQLKLAVGEQLHADGDGVRRSVRRPRREGNAKITGTLVGQGDHSCAVIGERDRLLEPSLARSVESGVNVVGDIANVGKQL